MRSFKQLRERCWVGYKPNPGKKPYEKGSCVKEESDLDEDLRNWFDPKHPDGGWKRINSKGEAIGPCAREPGEAKPKCMSNKKRAKLSKKERASAVRAKRKHDPDADRKGSPINVSNFGKGKLSEDMKNLEEENKPTNPELWARAKSLAKSKFDVYPSAYANGWAAKWYKSKGGGWKSVSEETEIEENVHNAIKKIRKEETDTTEKVEMTQSQLHFIHYACEEILDYIEQGGEVEEWYQVKVAKSFSEFESLHSFIEGEKRRTGMVKEDDGLLDRLRQGARSYRARTPQGRFTTPKYKGQTHGKDPHGGGIFAKSKPMKTEDVELDEAMAQPDYSQSIKARQAKADKENAPFDVDKKPVAKATPGKYGVGPSTAKHLAKMAMQRQMKKEEVSEAAPVSTNVPKMVRDRKTGEMYDPNKKFKELMDKPEVKDQMKRMAKEDVEQIDEISSELAGKVSDARFKRVMAMDRNDPKRPEASAKFSRASTSSIKRITRDMIKDPEKANKGFASDADKNTKRGWSNEEVVVEAADQHKAILTVSEQAEIDEKKLTPAELKKREEIAKAMERENPGMDMSRKMAIATAAAKRVAEEWKQTGKTGTHMKTGEKTFEYAKVDKDGKQTGERHYRDASGKKIMGEEVSEEQIDEISMDTVKSYTSKAMRDTIQGIKDRNKGMARAYSRVAGTNKPLIPSDK